MIEMVVIIVFLSLNFVGIVEVCDVICFVCEFNDFTFVEVVGDDAFRVRLRFVYNFNRICIGVIFVISFMFKLVVLW